MKSESFKNPTPETEPNKESLNEQYHKLLYSYGDRLVSIKAIQFQHPGGATDPEVKSAIQIIDEERHQIHLKLVELGLRLDKNKADVLIDILAMDEDLKELGLPEFNIKKPEDITGWSSEQEREKIEKMKGDGKILLIFDLVTTFEDEEEDTSGIAYSEDHKERVKRAKLLAKEINEKFVSIAAGDSFHVYTEYLGVAISKKDLEKVAAIIRNNPKKFRLEDLKDRIHE